MEWRCILAYLRGPFWILIKSVSQNKDLTLGAKKEIEAMRTWQNLTFLAGSVGAQVFEAVLKMLAGMSLNTKQSFENKI